MGLLITGSFTSAEGISYTTLYVKLSALICEFAYSSGDEVHITVHTLTYLNEERRRANLQFAIPSPPIAKIFGFKTTLDDIASYPSGIVAVAYREIGYVLQRKGYGVVGTFEGSQTVVEMPPPPPLPVQLVQDVSGSVLDISGAVMDASGARVDVSGTVVDVSGSVVDVSGSVVDVSGSVMDVSGASQQSSESTQTTPPTLPPPSESVPE